MLSVYSVYVHQKLSNGHNIEIPISPRCALDDKVNIYYTFKDRKQLRPSVFLGTYISEGTVLSNIYSIVLNGHALSAKAYVG